jgi:hypothetical protein
MMRKAFGAQRPMKSSPSRSGGVKALDPMRATYNSLKKRFNVGKSNVIITPGYLRSEQVLGSQNQITFPILTNEGQGQRSTERRLGISDTFVITDLGIRILFQADGKTPGSCLLETFVNENVFDPLTVDALNTLYNGILTVKVGSITYIEALDVLRFKLAKTQQRDTLFAAGGAINANSGIHGLEDLAEIVPTIQFSGQEKNIVQVTLPEAANMSTLLGQNVAVFYAKGFLCQNAAPLLNR